MDLIQTLLEQPHALLQPNPALHNATVELAKHYLDPLASDITEFQQRRQQHERKTRKRKRGLKEADDEDLLKLKKIYTEGFAVEQIWQQSRRVLDAAADELDRYLPSILAAASQEDELDSDNSEIKASKKSVRFDDDVEEDSNDDESLGEEGLDWEYDGEDVSGEEDGGVEVEGEDFEEEDLSADEGSPDLGDETLLSEQSEEEPEGEELVKDRHGLNDGFFSIDNFNKQTQFLEHVDSKGDPDDGAASDEEDIDWAADPLGSGAEPIQPSRQKSKPDEEEDEDDEEEGPTFGNVDLNAPDSDMQDDMNEDADLDGDNAGMGEFSNTNDITYKDFFAPPAKSSNKSKKQWSRKNRQSPDEDENEDDAPILAREDDAEDDNIERAMSGVHRDLFADEASDEEADAEILDDLLPSQRNLSSHERAQLALRAEIRKLEAENVAAKPWALTGESVAHARPQNGLLEEDLDFERAGKPVPVPTAELTESIEDLIKRRILAKEFDEVRRRRPDDLLNTASDPRRGRAKEELSDAKPKQGLAEEYEQDYLKQNDPNYVDTRSEALKAQHKQIEQQWASISAQLDALSNWHYKPRPAAPSMDVRVDVPTIAMEDARPSAGGDVGGASALAPQEVYRVGEDGKRTGEVVTKGGTVAAKDEESREQRIRRRRRQKERRRKAEGNKPAAVAKDDGSKQTGKKRANKSEVLGQLKKGGVKVIGKKGELQDVEGKAVRGENGKVGAGNYKL